MIISEAKSCVNDNTNQPRNQEKPGYVYRHIRLDTNMPFYIGISTVNNGKYTRAYTKSSRSKEWHGIIDNCEYEVEILLKDVPISILGDKEKYFIKLYGRVDLGTGTLVNKNSGGKGNCGIIVTKETRKKQSDAKKGKKASEETRKKMRNKKYTEEMLKKMRGVARSPEHIEKMSKKVGQYKDGILIKEYPSIKSVELDGYNFGAVGACCRGVYGFNTHKGYGWRFL